MPTGSIDLVLRQEEAYNAFYEEAKAKIMRDRDMVYSSMTLNEWDNMGLSFSSVSPPIEPHDIEKRALEKIAKGLAKSGSHGIVPQDYSDAAMHLLDKNTGRHSSEAVLSEILSFYANRRVLNPVQHERFIEHVTICGQCQDTDEGIYILLPWYELELGRGITEFPPRTIGQFRETCAGIITDESAHRNFEVLGAAPYLLNTTRNNHVGIFGKLADIMLRMATDLNGLSESVTRAYNRHYNSCRQCQTGMKNFDFGALPDFPRLVERKPITF